jgi:hypothetical protein
MAEICENEYAKLFFLKHSREAIPTAHLFARWIAMGSIVHTCCQLNTIRPLKKSRSPRGVHERMQAWGKQSLFRTQFFMS